MFKAISKARAKKGFTLVELIVVIAIIAILMLVLVPSLLAYINKANKSKAESNAKMVYDAALAAYTTLVSEGSTTITSDDIAKQVSSDGTIKSGTTYFVSVESNTICYALWGKSAADTGTGDDKGTWAKWPKN